MAAIENLQLSREKFWEEMSADEKLEKLAHTVEMLARWIAEGERERTFLMKHQHSSDGGLMVPIPHNVNEPTWYRTHLLNRDPSKLGAPNA